mgnify:FL=1
MADEDYELVDYDEETKMDQDYVDLSGVSSQNENLGLSGTPMQTAPRVPPHQHFSAPSYTEKQQDAIFAEEAYQAKRANIAGFNYIPDLSDERTAVYHNPRTGKSYVAYRGTASFGDAVKYWPSAVGTGTLDKTKRVSEALEKYDLVRMRFGGQPRVTGHSLGGQIAKIVSREKGAPGAAFNESSSSLGYGAEVADLCKKNPATPVCKDFKSYRIAGDIASSPFSGAGLGSETETYKQSGVYGLNSHFMHQFLNPEGDFWKSTMKPSFLPTAVDQAQLGTIPGLGGGRSGVIGESQARSKLRRNLRRIRNTR